MVRPSLAAKKFIDNQYAVQQLNAMFNPDITTSQHATAATPSVKIRILGLNNKRQRSICDYWHLR
jgi:hypothetical protein